MASGEPTNHEFPNIVNALDTILDHSLEGFAIIGERMTIEYLNERVCEILGRERSEVLGKPFDRFVYLDGFNLLWKRHVIGNDEESTSSIHEAKLLHSDGKIGYVRICTSPVRNGESSIKILAHITDITKERMFQIALNQQEVLYQTLVKTMNEGLGVIDDQGILVQANPTLCRMLEYSDEELVGKSRSDIFSGMTENEVFRNTKERISGKSERYETRVIHSSGQHIPVMVSASPLFKDTGEYAGSCVVFTDMSKQKALERHLQVARNRALLYLDLMGHDIRNHLQEIQASAELLQFKGINPSLSGFVEDILNAVVKSSVIISNSKILENLAILPLRERFLDEVLCESMKDVSVLLDEAVMSLSLHVTDARIKADDYLELLVSDLLINSFESNTSEPKRVWVDLEAQGPFYVLSVSDNSPGIPDRNRPGLSDINSRTARIGLHLAHHIVSKYDGTIEVHNRVNNDSTQGKSIRMAFPRLE
ncbi:MAG: PAS domain S-box protein [Promethearchaeota archaeon]